MKWQNGCGSLMFWGAFSTEGKASLAFSSYRLYSYYYQQLLEQHLVPFLEALGSENAIFQQDNAPCHSSRSTKEWFEAWNIEVIDWPTRSPDLNSMENVWGLLSQRVYPNNRQFGNIDYLRQKIEWEWELITQNCLKSFVDSMTQRVTNVFKAEIVYSNNKT